jgi:hypothetical protein
MKLSTALATEASNWLMDEGQTHLTYE